MSDWFISNRSRPRTDWARAAVWTVLIVGTVGFWAFLTYLGIRAAIAWGLFDQ